ncbi:hypothetical protein [Paraferrimonas sp. SM1919]|uniref:hypothetical protein n=1 Tax=Paraferrimonas sp. SM1919 TaxID=2662263 RepID=UPI0013D63DE5|nr:hypothetical protein [Paraferrimonas sp. SM1919]
MMIPLKNKTLRFWLCALVVFSMMLFLAATLAATTPYIELNQSFHLGLNAHESTYFKLLTPGLTLCLAPVLTKPSKVSVSHSCGNLSSDWLRLADGKIAHRLSGQCLVQMNYSYFLFDCKGDNKIQPNIAFVVLKKPISQAISIMQIITGK